MPVVNPLVRELVFKVVYYGPGLGGKTTSLQHVHRTAKPEHRGKMVSLATPVDRTLYFDFLPIRVPHVRGMGVRLQLFTVPGQVYYNATRKLVLTGVDGIVMVLDSQRERMDANLESLENLRDNLRAHGKSLDQMPHVLQYNKRDLDDTLPLEELERQFNRHAAPAFSTTATTGEGVYEALEAITRAVLDDFARRTPESRALEFGTRLELPEGGLIDALRRAEDESARPSVPDRVSLPLREPSGLLNLSELPDSDVGEAAARALAGDTALPPASRPVSSSPAAVAVPPPRIPSERAAMPSQNGAAGSVERSLDVPDPLDAPSSLSPAVTQSLVSVSQAAVQSVHPSILPPAAGFSFEILWPSSERSTVQELERSLGLGDFSRAVSCADRLVARTLASAGALLGGSADAPRDPSTAALLLGLDGRRYLELRALVRDARSGRHVAMADALKAYAVAIEARLLRARVGA